MTLSEKAFSTKNDDNSGNKDDVSKNAEKGLKKRGRAKKVSTETNATETEPISQKKAAKSKNEIKEKEVIHKPVY